MRSMARLDMAVNSPMSSTNSLPPMGRNELLTVTSLPWRTVGAADGSSYRLEAAPRAHSCQASAIKP